MIFPRDLSRVFLSCLLFRFLLSRTFTFCTFYFPHLISAIYFSQFIFCNLLSDLYFLQYTFLHFFFSLLSQRCLLSAFYFYAIYFSLTFLFSLCEFHVAKTLFQNSLPTQVSTRKVNKWKFKDYCIYIELSFSWLQNMFLVVFQFSIEYPIAH